MMSIWTIVTTHLIAFFREVLIAFATDGAKAGIKRIVRGMKKEATNTLEAKIDYLINQSKSTSNATIREITQNLNGLISSLHVCTAHEILLKLRPNIPTSDLYTLSIVDYALGCCSRYISKEACLAEFDRAYKEMIGAQRYDPDIIAGKIYCICVEKNKTEASRMACGLKGNDRMHPWAWIPELAMADDMKDAYNKLPNEIKANPIVLSTASILNRSNDDFCVDIFQYNVQFPESLEFENIPVWIFNLNILVNRYIQEWDADAFTGDTPIGPKGTELYDYSSRFINLIEKTELGGLSTDVKLFNLITGYKKNKDEATLEKIKQSKPSPHFLLIKQISYALFLANKDRFEDAKSYLKGDEIVNDAIIYNVRFYLAVASFDEEYAKETLHQLVKKNIQMTGSMLVYLLMAIKDCTNTLIGEARQVSINDVIDNHVYTELLNSFHKEAVNTGYLLDHRGDAALGLRPFMAMALFDNGHKNEAIDLIESCVRDGCVDFCSNIYFNLLKQSKSYSRLDKFLRKMRESGYTENPDWLREEYLLAEKEEDFPRMLKIAEALYLLAPKNASYFTCYFIMQYRNGNFDKVKTLSNNIYDYEFSPEEISNIFYTMLLSDLVDESVDFLYYYVHKLGANEQLYLLYHSACMNPKTAVIIRKEYDVVEDGSYVHYMHNGKSLSDVIIKGQRTDCMIGKKKGEVATIQDRLGRDENYEVISIFNKYYQLLEEIYKAFSENKFQTAFSFTIEDLTAGGSLLEGLAKLTGHNKEWQDAYNRDLNEYKQGRKSLYAFFHSENYIEELYNNLFGTFKVYNIPRNDFEFLYKRNEINLEEMEFVLDLSSLILLYEIHLKFGIDYTKKFVIPQGITHQINSTIAKEEYGMQAGIFKTAVEKLAPINIERESWFLTRLKGLKQWIEDMITVEQVHEMVDVDMGADSLFGRSRYLTLEYQSIALTMRGGRVFVSEDMVMPAVYGIAFPVADVNLYMALFHPDNYTDVSHFFIESDIYGGDIDVKYFLDQYEKDVQGKENSFVNCKENVSFCLCLYPVILNFCSLVLTKSTITPGDKFVVDSLLRSMFSRYEQRTALSILTSAIKQLPHMKQILLAAYKSIYSIV